jgi:hypothetical protein
MPPNVYVEPRPKAGGREARSRIMWLKTPIVLLNEAVDRPDQSSIKEALPWIHG